MRRLTISLAAITVALALTGASGAATIGDLQAMGFSVSVSSQLPGATQGSVCNVYYISGWGVGTYANECDATFQSTIDSLANPTAQCNRVWQYNHPDQLAAFNSIVSKGWSISGNQCADVYTVTNPNDGTTAYSGSGAGLPGFDAANGAPPAPAGGAAAPSSPSSGGSTGGACLPLCPNPGDTLGGGGGVIPAPTTTTTTTATTLTSTSVVAPITDPTVAPAAAVILFPDRSAGYLERAGFGSGGALTP